MIIINGGDPNRILISGWFKESPAYVSNIGNSVANRIRTLGFSTMNTGNVITIQSVNVPINGLVILLNEFFPGYTFIREAGY